MAVQISGNDITVPRDTTVTRNLTVGGVLTYEDVTNVDSVGLITARAGIRIGGGTTVGPSSGIVTYYGDGSNLTGVVSSDAPMGSSAAETIFYEIDNTTTISTTTTLSRTSSNPGKLYTKFQEVVVGTAPGTVELIVADGEEFVIDAYQLGVV